ncbi:MAG: hypothetical protein V1754_08745 [Pseudomonadota bacterium]
MKKLSDYPSMPRTVYECALQIVRCYYLKFGPFMRGFSERGLPKKKNSKAGQKNKEGLHLYSYKLTEADLEEMSRIHGDKITRDEAEAILRFEHAGDWDYEATSSFWELKLDMFHLGACERGIVEETTVIKHAKRILTLWYIEQFALPRESLLDTRACKLFTELVYIEPSYLYLATAVEVLKNVFLHQGAEFTENLRDILKRRKGNPRQLPDKRRIRQEYLAIVGELENPTPVRDVPMERLTQVYSNLLMGRIDELPKDKKEFVQKSFQYRHASPKERDDIAQDSLKSVVYFRKDRNEELRGLEKAITSIFPFELQRDEKGNFYPKEDPAVPARWYDKQAWSQINVSWKSVRNSKKRGDNLSQVATELIALSYGLSIRTIKDYVSEKEAKGSPPPLFLEPEHTWSRLDSLITADELLETVESPFARKCGLSRKELVSVVKFTTS